MRISHAIKVVRAEQDVFDHVTSYESAVRHVLDTLITQAEFDAGKWVPGVHVMEGIDLEHPEFNEGYFAHKQVIEWYRNDIPLTEYLMEKIIDELGGDEGWDAPFDSQEDALATGIAAGIRARNLLDNHDEGDPSSEVPAAKWAEWLGDSDPAMDLDMYEGA